ncbi:MAG TPA: L,D-transpeptidase family protein [Thermoleophilaceae bacterium]|nr:L,D-transpeptidase family protein [Thermoleophilaceae bacterium]
MRSRSFIAVVVILVVLLAGAAAVYAYDSSRAETIARGVTAGDLELAGLTAEEARAVLERRMARPLRRPVKVRYKGRTFRLTARRARVRPDVDTLLDEALARSREGNLLTRTVRDLSGQVVAADLEMPVSYSRRAVARLVRRVKREFDRPAREPSVTPSASGLDVRPGRRGLEFRAARLRRQVARELLLPGNRVVRPRPRVTRPDLTRAQLRGRYPSYITIDRSGYRLRYYRNLRLADSYTIAVGKVGLETPAGVYDIRNKAVDPAWHVPKRRWAGRLAGKVIPGGRSDNPLKARWMGIVDGAGIHGTDDVASLGTNASHGCIRMAIPDVKELYDRVPVGAPVYIG